MSDRLPSHAIGDSAGRPGRRAPEDVRLRGFPDRAALEEAQAWLDARERPLDVRERSLVDAAGCALAVPLAAPGDLPAAARAGVDGYAVRSADTAGASAYDPLTLRLEWPPGAPPGGRAALVAAGAPLPLGADAVLGFDAAEVAGAVLGVIAAVPEGTGVERAGQQVRAGAPLLQAGRRLGPAELALLASLGVAQVAVLAAPRVRLVVPGPKGGAGSDACTPLLRALVDRDGGAAEPVAAGGELEAALRAAAAEPAPALVLVAGRTGTGADDEAPRALAALGSLVLHGVALRPGGSAGLGLLGELPVVLLPGDPLACLVAYELLAGRLLRRLAGRAPGLPHRTVEAPLSRKLVSAVGITEVCQVRLHAGAVEPLGVAEFGGLATAARADGFVVVPAALEGYPPGARITVHLHDAAAQGAPA